MLFGIRSTGRVFRALWFLSALLWLLPMASRAEAPRSAPAKPLRFVVYGDTRDGHDVHRKLVVLIMAQDPDLVLQTGDLVHRGSDAELWKTYDDITGSMRRIVPVYPSRGNHDLGGPGYEERVTAPFTSGNKLYYSFDKGGCHFVSVDSFSSYKPGSPQYEWLEKDLAAAQKKAAHTFVYFHTPPYSIGAHGSDLTARRILCPLFTKYGVRAVFNGHDHIYYRTRRDGVTYVVTGGGGAPLYPTDPNKGAIEGDKWGSVNHILVCDVSGKTVTMTALRADGTTLDRFSIHAP
ncbi:MAG TPA: metallophosphoesterase [Chthonomonadaceae bacterium]|nr:metallophosphoesterase [Chthonomonadaceae bacterium]